MRSRRGVDRQRDRGSARPHAHECEELEDCGGPEPEAKAAAIAAKRRRKGDVAAPAAREEIDGGEEERQQRRDQGELDRPAGQSPWAEVDVAPRAGSELHPRVEPAKELLGRASELAESPCVQPADLVEERGRRTLAAARQRQGGKPVREQRPLLVERERKREVGQLSEGACARGPLPGLLEDPRRSSLDDSR